MLSYFSSTTILSSNINVGIIFCIRYHKLTIFSLQPSTAPRVERPVGRKPQREKTYRPKPSKESSLPATEELGPIHARKKRGKPKKSNKVPKKKKKATIPEKRKETP